MSDQPASDPCGGFGQPGPEHERLARFVGVWRTDVTLWFDPSAEPMRSTGTMTNTSILGGRFVQHDYTGEGEMPYSGVGHFGFNAASGKHQGTWLDVMSTEITTEEGDYDESTDTYTMSGEVFHPGLGRTITKRSVIRVESDDRYVMEQFLPGPDGKDVRTIEIVYTRKE